MLDTRWSKIMRDLWMYKARSALIVLAIAVGVMTFGMTVTTKMVLERDLAAGYAASNPAHAVLSVAPFGDELLNRLAGLEDVQAVEARRVVPAKLDIGGGEWLPLELQVIPDFESLDVGRLKPEPGATLPPPSGSMLLERSLLNLSGVQINQRARVLMPDSTVHEIKVAGFVNDYGPLPSDMLPWAYGYLSFETLAGLLPDQARDDSAARIYNRLYVVTAAEAQERATIERAITTVVETVEAEGYPVLRVNIPEPGKAVTQDVLNAGAQIMVAIGLVSLALSAFLVINVMAALISQQVPQIGIIKSLGGRRAQITRLYLQMVLIFGLLALALALPLGVGGAFVLSDFYAKFYDFNVVSFGLPLQVLVLQVFSAVVMPLLAALSPVLGGARITIRQAISSVGPGGGDDLFSRLLARIKGLSQISNLSLRNVFRKRGRMALTLAALSLGGGMFIAVLGVRLSMVKALDDIERELDYDVHVDFAQPHLIEELEQIARQTPGVAHVECWLAADARRVFDSERVGGSFILLGVPAATDMVKPFAREGRFLRAGDENAIFMNAAVADLVRDVAVGDDMTLKIGHDERFWRLVGTSGKLYILQAHVRYADLAEAVGATGYATRLLVQTERSDLAFQSSVEEQLLEHLQEAGIQVADSWAQGKIMKAAAAQIDVVSLTFMMMAGLIASVGGLGLASTMGLNVLERTREIGVLRSLGAKGGVVRRMVILEGLAISLLSVVLAIPFSVPLNLALGDSIGKEVFMRPLEYTFSWAGMLFWLLLVVIIAILSSLLPANNAANLTIRETLAYEG